MWKWTGALLLAGVVTCLGNWNPAEAKKSAVKQTKKTVTSTVIPASKVNWQQLNPKRGDKSPKAATLWGDRNGKVPTGFLVKFVHGFSSPPHIHNVSYRGVVIQGLVHNDDPKAADMWMPAGSYWTQPAGEAHITSAKGKSTVAMIEIDKGPYLVLPRKKAFDNGERPVNVHSSNLIWHNLPSSKGIKISYLWGSPGKNVDGGRLLRLPSGFSGVLHSHGNIFRVVTIQGVLSYKKSGKNVSLNPGSYFSSTGKFSHTISCQKKQSCLLYVRKKSGFTLTTGK